MYDLNNMNEIMDRHLKEWRNCYVYDNGSVSFLRPSQETYNRLSKGIACITSTPFAIAAVNDDNKVIQWICSHSSGDQISKTAPQGALGYGPEDAQRVADYWNRHRADWIAKTGYTYMPVDILLVELDKEQTEELAPLVTATHS